jgi:hypothetical protein
LSFFHAWRSSKLATRFSEAIQGASRVAALPLGFEAKAQIHAARTLPKALYGTEVTLASEGRIKTLRAAIMRTSWGVKRKMRSADMALTLAAPGCRVDPVQALPFRTLATFRRMAARGSAAVREKSRERGG